MMIVWSRRALRHLVYIRQHIEKDSEQNAALVASRILEAVDLLSAKPSGNRQAWPRGRNSRACGAPNSLRHPIQGTSGAVGINCSLPRPPEVAAEAIGLSTARSIRKLDHTGNTGLRRVVRRTLGQR